MNKAAESTLKSADDNENSNNVNDRTTPIVNDESIDIANDIVTPIVQGIIDNIELVDDVCRLKGCDSQANCSYEI